MHLEGVDSTTYTPGFKFGGWFEILPPTEPL